ncbi:MAG: hypothetical protein U5J99_00830 [Parvularculaceae bacterium]|nr:hypothetical protein [Parvularculaceae bacterium]
MTEATKEGASIGVPPPQYFRVSLGERLGVAAAAVVLILLTIGACLTAAFLFRESAVIAIVLAAVAATIASFAGLVAREAVSRWRLQATIYAGHLSGFLPRRRGFVIGDPKEMKVSLGDIDRIETRDELFSSLGVTTGQRAYELVLKDGARIFLGADRDMLPAHFGRIVEAITARSHARLVDRGMIDGDAGFLLVAGVKVPDWSAPPLQPSDAERRMKARNRTPALLLIAAAFVVLARFIGN